MALTFIECKKCGALNHQTSYKCHNCGKRLYEDKTTSYTPITINTATDLSKMSNTTTTADPPKGETE